MAANSDTSITDATYLNATTYATLSESGMAEGLSASQLDEELREQVFPMSWWELQKLSKTLNSNTNGVQFNMLAAICYTTCSIAS